MTVVVALLTAAVVGACGGGVSSSSSTSTPSSAPTPTPTLSSTPPSTSTGGPASTTLPAPAAASLSAAKAKVLAAAAVLTGADLPGYTAKAQTHDTSDDALDAKMAGCLGVTAPVYLTRNFGTAFSRGDLEVDSSADVATSEAAAKRELATMTASRTPGCLRSQLGASLAGLGLTVTSISAKPTSVTIPGSDAAFVYTMLVAGTVQGAKVEIRGYSAGTLVGQVEVGLSVFAPPGTAFTLEQVKTLLTKATARTIAAS
jgi:hypothetical protein